MDGHLLSYDRQHNFAIGAAIASGPARKVCYAVDYRQHQLDRAIASDSPGGAGSSMRVARPEDFSCCRTDATSPR